MSGWRLGLSFCLSGGVGCGMFTILANGHWGGWITAIVGAILLALAAFMIDSRLTAIEAAARKPR